MALSEEKMREYSKRILMSRMRVLMNNGFYGLLLMYMRFAIDEECETAATDGEKIFFAPKFLESIDDKELDFVLMHEVMHVALCHCFRVGEREKERFDIACDIVVNSNILLSNNMNIGSIALKNYGICSHKTPKGDEGYEYTAEEVYEMLPPLPPDAPAKQGDGSNKGGKSPDTKDGEDKGDVEDEKNGKNGEDKGDAEDEKDGKNGDGKGDAEDGKDGEGGNDEGGGGNEEGDGADSLSGGSGKSNGKKDKNPHMRWDSHRKWNESLDDEEMDRLKEEWKERIIQAAETIRIDEASISNGAGLPMFAQRMYDEALSNQIDWKEILHDFIQDEVNDYSFSPPDRRFDDSPFFLPDFNEREERVENIWFVVDTSGSIGDSEIGAAYAEICNAIEQFNGKLKGLLSFTERIVTEPVEFESVEDVKAIKPTGGGGNDFADIFRYMQRNMIDDLPKYVVIITDGYDAFPPEEMAMGVPVMWLINNDRVYPPWGKIARIDVKKLKK